MRLESMLSKALKANPEVAEKRLEGCAIVFVDGEGVVHALKVAMTEERLKDACAAIHNAEARHISSAIA